MTMATQALAPISLRFVADLPIYKTQKLYEIWMEELPPGIEKTNVRWDDHHNIPVLNMRKHPTSLSTTGFTFVKHTSECLPNFIVKDGEELSTFAEGQGVTPYLQETCDFVKKLLGAEIVLIMDWRHRKNTVEAAKSLEYLKNAGSDRMKVLKPALNVHLDDSKDGSLRRLSRILSPEELEKYDMKTHRVRFLNFWRPLVPVVVNAPLAICDMRTIKDDDIVTVDKVHATHVNEANYVKYNDSYTWYHLPYQTREEPFIFITWDSDSKWPSPGAPHAAFDNPIAKIGDPMRESIEVRIAVITKR